MQAQAEGEAIFCIPYPSSPADRGVPVASPRKGSMEELSVFCGLGSPFVSTGEPLDAKRRQGLGRGSVGGVVA